jgi:hypothetical protein
VFSRQPGGDAGSKYWVRVFDGGDKSVGINALSVGVATGQMMSTEGSGAIVAQLLAVISGFQVASTAHFDTPK